MPRSEEAGLKGNAVTASNLSSQYNTAATGVGNTLVPSLTSEATNPQGFSMSGLNAMRTANLQGVGGATAGAVGEGNLAAARTRNAGGFQGALDEAARSGQRQISQNAEKIEAGNEEQRQANQQAGLRGLQGAYNTDVGAATNALGLSNQAWNDAGNLAFDPFKSIIDPLIAAGGAVGAGFAGKP